MFEIIYRISVIVLLVIVVAILGYGQLISPSTPSGCKDAIAKAEIITSSQGSIISEMFSNYEDSV
jgi:hypothetical protein